MKVSSSVSKALQVIVFICFIQLVPLFSEPLYSPTWGFRISPPAGYTYTGGDGKSRFSFSFEPRAPAYLDIRVYEPKTFSSVEALGADIRRRISSSGDMSTFMYHGRQALLMELNFSLNGTAQSGWGLCIELGDQGSATHPLLAALAYGDASLQELSNFHLSALDSIAPAAGDTFFPGPISEYAYPEQAPKETKLTGLSVSARLSPDAALASKATVDREFAVLSSYGQDSLWKEAWIRFYQMIYRDSFDRLSDVAFAVERSVSQQIDEKPLSKAQRDRLFAEQALAWIQGFTYERDLLGSDFVDLISAATEGRGDCDSRAMLWAIILRHNNIPSAIMVSREYSHAMGLVLVEGSGARFTTGSGEAEKIWVVAETTAQVPLGLIGRSVADPAKWIPVLFE